MTVVGIDQRPGDITSTTTELEDVEDVNGKPIKFHLR